ncbi:undecaprenyl-diphosphatase [Microbacteriaceae bacterium 4G12]
MNYTVFQWINNLAGHSALLDKLMVAITKSAPVVAILFMLLLWFSNAPKTKAIAKQYTVIYTTLSLVMALVLNAIIHFVYYHPRPFVTHHVNKLVAHAADSSFVSDHSVLVFAIAFTLLLRDDTWKNIAFIWAVIVGVSRIYVGVHYPADVIGGAALSFLTSAVVLQNATKLEPFVRFVLHMYHKATKRIPILSKYSYVKQDL